MIATTIPSAGSKRWLWWSAFAAVALYVAIRMGAFALWADVTTPDGVVRLPKTFASVDHPFHVARADTLWRALTSGSSLRWIGQHQGGYPVEFYPLGAAWMEVALRAISLGTLPAEGAHTLAIIGLFLLPGVAFAMLTWEDRWSPAVGLLAFVLHVSLPGGWYDGGYTELVQWGLETNVAGAVAAFAMLPAIVRFLRYGEGWAGALATLLAAWAIYCNPRSLLGLMALGAGAWLAVVLARVAADSRGAAAVSTHPKPLSRRNPHPNPSPFAKGEGLFGSPSPVSDGRGGGGVRVGQEEGFGVRVSTATRRLALVAILSALLAAPELIALTRYGDLYSFVRYSGYEDIADYAATAASAVSLLVLALAFAGLALGLVSRMRVATSATSLALALYAALTIVVTVVPAVAVLAPQLEPTRLMPLQRLLTIYLAAVALGAIANSLAARVAPRLAWAAPAVLVSAAVLAIMTRPLPGPPPDPASPAIPSVSLYPVVTSAQPQQFDLEASVRAADAAARPGTAMLILGSALSWHQQLWAPLWTARPLYYDNWLWYWRPDHAGTPGYDFQAGHHYPDPERALDQDYLARHGIGAVVVTADARPAARRSPNLRRVREGLYGAYTVVDPVTTVTFDGRDAASLDWWNQRVSAASATSGSSIAARINWHPRWEAVAAERAVDTALRRDGYIDLRPSQPSRRVELTYALQPVDWLARALAGVGFVATLWLAAAGSQLGSRRLPWYPQGKANAAASRTRPPFGDEEGKEASERTNN